MIDLILQLALAVVAAILAITLHEAAHGYAALALGDDTARQAGRLSLNPLRHVDRVGTILLPGFLLIVQLLTIGRVVFMFGWAKPVPVGGLEVPQSAARHGGGRGGRPGDQFPARVWLGGRWRLFPPVSDDGVGSRSEHPSSAVPVLFHAVQPRAGTVQPAADPAAGRRPHRGRPAAAALARRWARLERAGILMVLLVVFLLPLARAVRHQLRSVPRRAGTVLPWALRVVLFLSGHDIRWDAMMHDR